MINEEEIKEKVKKIILEVMNVNIEDYNPDKSIADISEWDSFNSLMMITELQSAFSIDFSALEIENIEKIGDILKTVKKKVEEK